MPNLETNVVSVSQTVKFDARKHPASLGKLNRTTAKAAKILEANGHENTRFKRDYTNGTASYACIKCGAGALATSSQGRGKSTLEGNALTNRCTSTTSEPKE